MLILFTLFSCEKELKTIVIDERTGNPPTQPLPDPGDTIPKPYLCSSFNITDYIFFQGTIIDAGFDRVKNRIVAITYMPNAVLIIYPETKKIDRVPLSGSPDKIDLHPYGHRAAVLVGSRTITLVQLDQLVEQQSHNTNDNVYDLVYGKTGFVYFSTSRNQIKNLRTSDGQITDADGNLNMYNSRIVTDELGENIYVSNGINLASFSITNGKAKLTRERSFSTYTERPDGKNWIANNTIFTQNSNAYSISSDSTNNLEYRGTLPKYHQGSGNWSIYNIAERKSNNTFWAINRVSSNQTDTLIREYSTSLNLLRTIRVPQVQTPMYCYKPRPKYGWFNNAGTRYYALGMAISSEPRNELANVITITP